MVGGKDPALESVRGLAAVAVVLSHHVLAFQPIWVEPHQLPGCVTALFNGAFAVRVFFALSGFVLTVGFYRTGRVELLRSAAVRRYVRLAVPVAASVGLSYLLLANHLYFNRAAGVALGQSLPVSWLLLFFDFPADPATAAAEAAWGAFFDFRTAGSYNPVLWTMQAEFAGSVFVFAVAALTGGLRNRLVLYAAVGVAAAGAGPLYLLDFLAGLVLADVCTAAPGPRRADGPAASVSVLLVAVGLTAAGVRSHLVATLPEAAGRLVLAVRWAGPLLVVAGVVMSPAFDRLLGLRPLVWLGRLSFPLYLVHVPVLGSVGCWSYLELTRAGWGHGGAGLLATAASGGASFGLAWVGAVTVEPFAVRLGKSLDEWLFRPAG